MHKKKIVASMSMAMALLAQTTIAHSAGLGKLSVESALGQPLQAEIDVIATDPAELSNLHARLASPEAFRKANLELNNTITHIKFALDKKTDGGLVLKLTSDKPVNDPFIDMLVELDWGNGKMLREYTILLDPPNMKAVNNGQNNGNLIVSPAVTGATGSSSSSVVQRPSSSAVKAAAQAHTESRTFAPPAQVSVPDQTADTENAGEPQTVGPIKHGENLSEIAERTKPDGIHLEQMLVGLYRHNEKAFDGNMNRLKTGQILTVPSKAEIASVSEKEAVREVQLQAADWHSYRQKLAGEVANAPSAAEKPAQASGKITSTVEDKAAVPNTGKDVLKLSKGEMPANTNKYAGGKSAANAAMQRQMAQDDAEARQKALAEARERAAALEKNNQAMKKLLALKGQAVTEAKENHANPVAPIGVKPPVPAAKPAVKPLTPLPATGNWYEALNPLYVGAGAVILLLLALFGFMNKSRNRRQGLSKFENSILTDVDHKPNTVYGAPGGASVNTSNNTSFLTDFSQSGLGTLDTHEVDPIAEAEVYMAYGRDEQAEEILKEAMIKDPARHEIKLKLLEIYAARNNLPAFESIATELYSALNGEQTPVWEKAAELGRKLDPKNPLYGGQSSMAPLPENVSLNDKNLADRGDDNPQTIEMPEVHGATASMTAEHDEAPVEAMDFPMAMDFDIEMTPVNTGSADAGTHAPQRTEAVSDNYFGHAAEFDAIPSVAEIDQGLDFVSPHDEEAPAHGADQSDHELFAHEELLTTPVEIPHASFDEEALSEENKLNFDFNLEDSHAFSATDAVNAEHSPPVFESDEGPITLDFSGIDLNLDSPAAEETVMSEAEQEVKTKFELAQVYQEMGDHENAREILQEVIAEGNPQQQANAQELLQKLG